MDSQKSFKTTESFSDLAHLTYRRVEELGNLEPEREGNMGALIGLAVGVGSILWVGAIVWSVVPTIQKHQRDEMERKDFLRRNGLGG
jgi:hypothetical protein